MADINEDNKEVDPYEALAAALSGNTETAVNSMDFEPEVAAEPVVAETVEPVQEEVSPVKSEEREVHPTDVGQAQTWFKVEGLVDKLDIDDLASLQLAQKENPNSFTDAQRQQVKDLAWQKIQNVANRKDKLESKDYKGFDSLLKNVPAAYRMETSKELDTVKSAETRLYRAKNGIEDKSLGEKTKDGFNKAKLNSSKALKQSKTGLKNAFNAGLNKLDKGMDNIEKGLDKIDNRIEQFENSVSAYAHKKKEQVKKGFNTAKLNTSKVLKQSKTGLKNAFNSGLDKLGKGLDNIDNAIDSGLDKIDEGVDKMVGRINKFGKSVSAYAYKKKAKALDFIKNNKLVRGTKKVIKGTKKAYKGTIKFGKKAYNFGKKTVKAVQTGYKNTKNFFKKELTDKEKAVKLSKGNLDKLTPEQIAFVYNTLKDINQVRDPHSKEVNALYAVKGFADRKMDAINADKSIMTASNAKQAAEWLNISQDVQDKVNHNRVEAKNERNNNVALALQSYGLDTKMVTATEKQEAVTKTDVNSDTQAQAVKQEMINTSSENIVQVQKNEQEAEKNAKPKEPEKPKETKQNPQTYDSEALSAALSGNTGTAVNAMSDEKVKTQSQTPNQPMYDSEALSAALSGNTGTAVNAAETEKPKAKVTEEKNILNQLSGRSNAPVPTQGLNPDKNLTMDKAPSQAASSPSDTFVATPEMFKEPKTDDKSALAPEVKSPEQKSDKGPKKQLTKEQKIARKLFRKSGRGKYSSGGAKGSPTIVRTLDPKLQSAAKSGRQSA